MSSDFTLKLPCPVGQVSDGYHTFDDLYEHRCLLFLNLLQASGCNNAWVSKLHDDGTMFDGWFIAGLDTPNGQITYHLPMKMWELCGEIKKVDKAPKWDGHSPNDVLERLRARLHRMRDGR